MDDADSQQIFPPPAPDESAGQLTIGSRWADTDNIKRYAGAFRDPDVQQLLATDGSVKDILLPAVIEVADHAKYNRSECNQ